MKKQILAVAVASTLATTSMASISLSGAYEGTWEKADSGAAEYTDKFDLKVSGKSGDITAVTTLDIDNGTGPISVGETYFKTSLNGLSVKGGKMKGQKGNGLTYEKTTSSKVTLGTSFSGIGISASQATNDSNASITLSGSFGGVKTKIQEANGDNPTTSLTTSLSGVNVAFEQNDDTTAYSLGPTIGGTSFTYAKIDAINATQNDGIFGDISDADVTASGLVVSTATGLGKVTGKHFTVDKSGAESTTTKVALSSGPMSYTYSTNDVSGDSVSAKIKFSF